MKLGHNEAYCCIRKNGSNQVRAYSNPDSVGGGWYSQSSNTLILRLSHGDNVDLGDCTDYDTMDYPSMTSSFSVFLLYEE